MATKTSKPKRKSEKAPDGTRRLGAGSRFDNAHDLWTVYNEADGRRKPLDWEKLVKQYDRIPYKDDDKHVIPNFGSMRFKIDRAMTTYVDYATERERWALVKTDEGEVEGNSALWGEHITTAFHKHCIENWEAKFSDIILSVRDMLMFVRGAFVWESKCCVYPVSTDISHVVPDSNAGMFPKDFDILFLKKRYTAVELYRKVSTEAAEEASGWRKTEVMDILKNASASMSDMGHEEIFTRFGTGRALQSERDFVIDTVCAYVTEYDDEEGCQYISHYVIPATAIPLTKESDEDARGRHGFLCFKENYYDSMSQVIAVVASAVSRSFWEGKSYAELIYLTSRTYDLVMYRVLQAIEDNMRVYIKSDTQEHFEKLKKMRHKQYNLLGPGVSLEQQKFVRPVQESMMVLRTLMSDERAGTGQYEVGGGDVKGGAKTAKQSEIDLGESLKISGSELKMFNAYMTSMMVELYRRFVSQEEPEIEEGGRTPWKALGRFKKYLKSRNVPESAWKPENVRVTSVLSLGAGSPAARLQAARVTTEALANPASGPGERRAQRDMIAAVQGIENVDFYLPQDEQLSIPEDSIIGFENDILSDAQARPQNTPVLPHHMHFRHIQSHMQDSVASLQIAEKLIQNRSQMPQVDDGIVLKTIADTLIGVDHKMSHIAAHMKLASKTKSKQKLSQLDQFKRQLAGINRQQDALENVLKEAMTPRMTMSQQPQANPELEHKKVMYQLEEEHTAMMLKLDAEKSMTKGEQLRQQSAANTQHKQNLETVKTAAQIRRDSAIAATKASIEIKNKENEKATKK